MDKQKTELISNVLIKLNDFDQTEYGTSDLIHASCELFDFIKDRELSNADIQFLFFIANTIGIPQYYSMLQDKFNKDTDMPDLTLDILNIACKTAELTIDNRVLHKFQKEILDLYQKNQVNKYFLSASTSFGKTYLMYEIIKKKQYKNILLIFPTIALLSENYEKIISDPGLKNYTVHTLSQDGDISNEYNIFIFTPERYLSFIEINGNQDMDFVFVDEVYKLDNDFIVDEEQQENERDTAYRLALFFSNLKSDIDVFLCGPYIDIAPESSFAKFLEDNNIKTLDYNNIELVNKKQTFYNNSKGAKLLEQLEQILLRSENTLIYCKDPGWTEIYAKKIIKSNILDPIQYTEKFKIFVEHLERTYSPEWSLIKCLKRGLAFHHGLVPKYIQKEIISFFNDGIIKVLLSTTTITEGVNTSAKNMIILHATKGAKKLKKFDAQNITGRAGRFLEHYSGNVVILDKEIKKILDDPTQNVLRHKNYELITQKDPRDIFNVEEKYLNDSDLDLKRKTISLIELYSFPPYVVERSKVFSVFDKVLVYKALKELSNDEIEKISICIKYLQQNLYLEKNGFEIIVGILRKLNVKDENLQYFFGLSPKTQISRLYYALSTYLRQGFDGMFDFYFNPETGDVDTAMRQTSRTIFHTFKYGLVKYLSLFDLMYKHFINSERGMFIGDMDGLESLIFKLEYNAKTSDGLIASDYGAPNNVIKYFDGQIKLSDLDAYEMTFVDKIQKLVHKV